MQSKIQLVVQSFIFPLLLTSLTFGQITTTWTGADGTKFSDPANWTNGVPGNSDTAFLNLSDTYNVWLDFQPTINLLRVENGGDVSLIGGNPLNANFASINGSATLNFVEGTELVTQDGLIVGDFSDGNLQIQDGLVKSVEEFFNIIGRDVSSTGSVIVNGQNSRLETGNLILGEDGTGALQLEDGATALTQTDAVLGRFATGQGGVMVSGGSQWDVNGDVSVADGLNGFGTVIVTGPQSALNAGNHSSDNFNVGENGFGTLQVADEAEINSFSTSIGGQSDSTGIASISGDAMWNVSDHLYIGREAGSTGTVNLTGFDSELNVAGSLFVGGESGGMGTLNISSGGDVDLMFVGQVIVNELSTVNHDSGSITAPQIINHGAMFFSSNATLFSSLEITESGFADASQLLSITGKLDNNGQCQINAGGKIRVFGDRLSGAGIFTGTGELDCRANFSPGAQYFDVGTIAVDGDLILADVSLARFDIGGSSPSEYDRLVVDGDLDLEGGELSISGYGTFQFADGQIFELIDLGGTRTGTFDGLPEGALVDNIDGINLFISYFGGDGNDIVLTASGTPILYGDVNLDQAVNLLDVAPFVELLTSGLFQIEADCNMDGEVNLLDVTPFVQILTGG